jgi:hypothetical protein
MTIEDFSVNYPPSALFLHNVIDNFHSNFCIFIYRVILNDTNTNILRPPINKGLISEAALLRGFPHFLNNLFQM